MRPLDRIDRLILTELKKDVRISNRALARVVGLAESTTSERLRRLERDGVVLGAHAEIDPRALGANLQAMVLIRLQQHTRRVVESFRDDMIELPGVVSVANVTGAYDFMIRVAVADTERLRALVLDRITSRREVAQVETTLIFQYLESHRLPSSPLD